MKVIIENVSFKEYYLTMIRMITFLNYLGEEHKKSTTEDRLVLYDFYLKYPELINNQNKVTDFDTKYSYFHWRPNYKLYSAVLADLTSRDLIKKNVESGRYYINENGKILSTKMINTYIETLNSTSEYLQKNICKLSNKGIYEDIDLKILKERGI